MIGGISEHRRNRHRRWEPQTDPGPPMEHHSALAGEGISSHLSPGIEKCALCGLLCKGFVTKYQSLGLDLQKLSRSSRGYKFKVKVAGRVKSFGGPGEKPVPCVPQPCGLLIILGDTWVV